MDRRASGAAVAAQARHHLAVLAHVRPVAVRARRRVRGGNCDDARTKTREMASTLLSGASMPCLSPSENADLSVPSTLGPDAEMLRLQALELRRPLLERPKVGGVAGEVDRPAARSASRSASFAPGCLSLLSDRLRGERHRHVLRRKSAGKLRVDQLTRCP